MSSATSNWWSIGPMPTGTATALSTTSTAATAFGKGGGRYYIWASGCNAFLLTRISTVARRLLRPGISAWLSRLARRSSSRFRTL